MESLNFDSYFEESMEMKYYDPSYIITILENLLGSNIDDILSAVDGTQITATKEQISEFLKKRFEEEDPRLKKRTENSKSKGNESTTTQTDEDSEALSQRFIDTLKAKRYKFDPFSLEYFKKYADIVKTKALLLLQIIHKIGNRNSAAIQDLLVDLDINLDENGNISKDDIIRLITPTIYNIRALNEKVSKANDFSTYLTFKMSELTLSSEKEIYPSSSLQIKNLDYDHIEGNVPLSNAQRTKLEQERRKQMKKAAKMLNNLNL